MKVREINDDNSLVETYIHWFLNQRIYDVECVGHIDDEHSGLGIYLIINKDTGRYCLLTTDWIYYNDKRIKKPLTRFKKSTTFFYPNNEGWDKITNVVYNELIKFMSGMENKIDFYDTDDMPFIQNLLKMP
jgi:hypothetical protein